MVKHPWTKQDDDELELTEGEMIYVLGEPDEEGWCKGRKQDGTEGLFPADYVDMGEGTDLKLLTFYHLIIKMTLLSIRVQPPLRLLKLEYRNTSTTTISNINSINKQNC